MALSRLCQLLAAIALCTAAVPSLEELSGNWIDPYSPVSKHADPNLGGDQRDLPTVNNFWGSFGVAPEQVRPVDLFAVNAVELPPFAGCGAAKTEVQFGCGRMLIDNKHVPAMATKWSAHEAGRRSAQLDSGLVIETSTRMPYEQNGILWQIQLTNKNLDHTIKPTVSFELPAMMQQYVSLDWVFPTVNDPSKFNYSPVNIGKGKGVLSQSTSPASSTSRPAAALFHFVGGLQPDTVNTTSVVPSATFTALSILPGASVTIRVAFAVGGNIANATETASAFAMDETVFAASWKAARDKWQQRWENAFTPDNGDFSGSLPTLTLTPSTATSNAAAAAAAPTSGKQNHTTQKAPSQGANVERVYYMTILTFLSVMRTNLPLIHDKIFVTSQGNVGGLDFQGGAGGIGGTRGWFWDQSLVSMMIAMLEPAGRGPELQAWLTLDDSLMGKGGNGFQYDCLTDESFSHGCTYPNTSSSAAATSEKQKSQQHGADEPGYTSSAAAGGAAAAPSPSPKYGFYCYNVWAYFLTMSNHLRVNNDTDFLNSLAGKDKTLTVGI
jgi:hypothetical protein